MYLRAMEMQARNAKENNRLKCPLKQSAKKGGCSNSVKKKYK